MRLIIPVRPAGMPKLPGVHSCHSRRSCRGSGATQRPVPLQSKAESLIQVERTVIVRRHFQLECDRRGRPEGPIRAQRLDQPRATAAAAPGRPDVDLVDGADLAPELVGPERHQQGIPGRMPVIVEYDGTPPQRLLTEPRQGRPNLRRPAPAAMPDPPRTTPTTSPQPPHRLPEMRGANGMFRDSQRWQLWHLLSSSCWKRPDAASNTPLGLATGAARDARDHRRAGDQEKNYWFPPDLLASC